MIEAEKKYLQNIPCFVERNFEVFEEVRIYYKIKRFTLDSIIKWALEVTSVSLLDDKQDDAINVFYGYSCLSWISIP